jgi:CHAD domain-containing protein
MKTSKSHLKYLRKIIKKINSLLKKPSGKFENEDYHKLRVEVKKLNALLDLIQFCFHNFNKKKYSGLFKKVFKQAGTVREIQLEESTLKNYPNFSIKYYLSDLEKKVNKEKKIFAHLVNKKLIRKNKKLMCQLKPFINKILKKDSVKFLENERNKTTILMHQKPLKPEQVHKLRKRLKVDFYNRKEFDGPNKNIAEEDNLLELLGKWHDCRTLNNQLERAALKEEIDPVELGQLLEINAEISLNAKNLFNTINARIGTEALLI